MEKQPEDTARLVGGLGWVALAAYVAVWDYKADETLSAAFKRYQPYSTVPLVITAAHLMGYLPERFDPFVLGLNALKRNTMSS